MAMTRADFVEIADHLGLMLRFAEPGEIHGLKLAITTVAAACKQCNASFDPDKFFAHVDRVAERGLKG